MSWVGKMLRSMRSPPSAGAPAQPVRAGAGGADGRQARRSGDRPRTPLFSSDESRTHPVHLQAELDGAGDPTSLAELASTVERLAQERPGGPGERMMRSLAGAIRRDEIRLPNMPEVILRVQRVLEDPDCRVGRITAEVERDPALATRMVGIANSPFYAGLEPVRSLQEALLRLGMSEARNVVMALSVRGRVFRVPGFDTEVHALWEHALASSLAASSVAAAAQLDPDGAFFAGLIHDVGRVAVLSLIGDWQRAERSEAPVDPLLVQTLSERLHTKLGFLVCSSWRLTPDIAQAIAAHHDPGSAPPLAQELAHVLATADELAHQLQPGLRACDAERARGSAVALGIPPEQLDALAADAQEQLQQRFGAGS